MQANPEATVPTMKYKTQKPAKHKILLVDDDPVMLRVLFRILVQEEFIVFTAANGPEALELVNITKFDLVLLDLKARLEDEWATLKQLATRNPLLPVILITDRANQFFQALASDIWALLGRPLNFINLIRTIRRLLREPAEARKMQDFTHDEEYYWHGGAPVRRNPSGCR
jgi:DNA-binding NtrC family response regulator